MNLYEVLATYPNPEDFCGDDLEAKYRGIVGETEAEAICKAQSRHKKEGRTLIGTSFKVTRTRLIICASVIAESAA